MLPKKKITNSELITNSEFIEAVRRVEFDAQKVIDDMLSGDDDAAKVVAEKYPHEGEKWGRKVDEIIKRIPSKYGVVQKDSVTYELIHAIARSIYENEEERKLSQKAMMEEAKHQIQSIFNRMVNELKKDMEDIIKKKTIEEQESFLTNLRDL